MCADVCAFLLVCQYIVRGLDEVAARDALFEVENEAGEKSKTSVAEWFRQHHPSATFRDDLPCVLAGKASNPEAVKIPMELLKVAEAQPPEASQAEVAAEMIKHCGMKPPERFRCIEQITRDYKEGHVGLTDDAKRESRAYFDTFTLRFDEALETEARVLKPCEVVYKLRTGVKV